LADPVELATTNWHFRYPKFSAENYLMNLKCSMSWFFWRSKDNFHSFERVATQLKYTFIIYCNVMVTW